MSERILSYPELVEGGQAQRNPATDTIIIIPRLACWQVYFDKFSNSDKVLNLLQDNDVLSDKSERLKHKPFLNNNEGKVFLCLQVDLSEFFK